MDRNELPKKILWTNTGGQRGHGRPKSRWIEGVEEDTRKLGCKNWLVEAQDRGRWPGPTQGCTDDDGGDDADKIFTRICKSLFKFKKIK
jgi:hypothetical protein